MIKYKRRHRIIATFFMLIFFPTLVPTNIYASNNGPVAPEAASFEPVDATDMVNLVTGDMSYVLPLMNVPSPEGGYPLSLSYHAGIAMDQEASWVGLGWNLNPGTINRVAKGFPDDWDKTMISELLYDRGETLNYYDFSIGGTLPNGISLGMSKSWGANRAFGGSVGLMGINASFKGGNIGMSVGFGSLTFSMSESYWGMNIGVTKRLGLLPMGSIDSNLQFNTASNSLTVDPKFNAVGLSFSSYSVGFGIFGGTAAISSQSTTSTKGDYFIENKEDSFGFDAGFFHLKYQHYSFSYSLFLLNRNYVSGSLYPYNTKFVKNGLQDDRYYMDVKKYGFGDIVFAGHTDASQLQRIGDIVYPSYDNYYVSAQGFSGSFSPKVFNDMLIYGKGSQKKVTDYYPRDLTKSDELFLSYPSNVEDYNYKLNDKIYFYFDNTNSSFLRVKTGDFIVNNNSPLTIGDEQNILNTVNTQPNTEFDSLYTTDGNLKKNGNKKRDGNYIEAYTNEEIVDNSILNFIEAENFDRQKPYQFAKKGVGAYKITTIDGKVYHYSLPVYSYEEYYKNYSEVGDENEKFLESVRKKPYATHWLLTAITGPDYYDKNGNGKPDEEDFGYWVNFDYGKWTDGYGWRTPKSGGKLYQGKYTYSFGIKEVYYLDKIKTRTHTALFLKSVRNDDKSTLLEYGKKDSNNQLIAYTGGAMRRADTETYSDRINRPIDQGDYYKEVNTSANTHTILNMDFDYEYRHSSFKYINVPVNHSLKLDKIVLLKNEDALSVSKVGTPDVNNRKKGYVYFDYGFFGAVSWLRKNPYGVRECNINMDQNVIETRDVNNLIPKAIKVIDFSYDYSMGSAVPNSSSGRLGLKKVTFFGRNNSKILPPYEFEYYDSNQLYNFNNMDSWGYIKNNVDAWSLKSIKMPYGASLNVDYEEDSFRSEIIKYNETYKKFSYSFCPPGNHDKITGFQVIDNNIKINFNQSLVNYSLNDIFQINSKISINFAYYEKYQYEIRKLHKKVSYKVLSIDNVNKTVVLKPSEAKDIEDQNFIMSNPNCLVSSGGTGNNLSVIGDKVNISFELSSTGLANIFQFGPNGKLGGGLRVKKIEILNSFGDERFVTEYSYLDPYANYISGTTTYAPTDNLEQDARFIGVEELPSPDVMYEYVRVISKNKDGEILKSTQYQFDTFNELIINYPQYNLGYLNEINQEVLFNEDFYSMSIKSKRGVLTTSKINIVNNLSKVGRVKKIDVFNSYNHLLESKTYNYKKLSDFDEDYGMNQETFKFFRRGNRYYRDIDMNGNYLTPYQSPRYFATSISVLSLSSQLESIVSSSGGYSVKESFGKRDFLTGQVLETTTTSSDGKSFKTKIVPAYTKYPQMGSKVDNINNRNMLSQVAATYSYIQDAGNWKVTGVGITTWNNIWSYQDVGGDISTPSTDKEKIWRKHKTFVWNGIKDNEGIFQGYNDVNESDDNFDWTVGVGSQPANWKQVSEISLYDHYSMPLEIKDINNNKAATKMDALNQKIEASGNAGYNEMYYSGAEVNSGGGFWVGQEVRNSNGRIADEKAHTGRYSIAATSNSQFGVVFRNGHRPGKYKISVWVHKDNYLKARLRWFNNEAINTFTFNGEKVFAGDWVLLNHYTDEHFMNNGVAYWYVNSNDNTTVFFDDLMIRPIASSMTGYVYNEYDELTHIIGNNGLATRFEYDEAGRLIKTYTEMVDDSINGVTGGFKLKSQNRYNYKNL